MTVAAGDILVSGGGIAGCTVAYWLQRHGFRPVVVERSRAPRKGGHAVDLVESAVDVAERMGVLADVEAARTRTDCVKIVRGADKETLELPMSSIAGSISSRQVEISRNSLSRILTGLVSDKTEFRYGDSIQDLREEPDGVRVTFASGEERVFAVVVGADGLHSVTRRLAFGPEERYNRFLDSYICIFGLPNYLGLGSDMVTYNVPNKMTVVAGTRDPGWNRALLGFRSDEYVDVSTKSEQELRDWVAEVFAGEGWETPRLLEELRRTDEFYFDSMSQIKMPSWSSGRVALVGDAAYSPSPLSGQGTSMAMVGAYVLAGELKAADGDWAAAFAAYNREMRPFVRENQEAGDAGVKALMPSSRAQLWVRDQMIRLAPLLGKEGLRKASKMLREAKEGADAVALKDY